MAIDKEKWGAMKGKNAFVNWRKAEPRIEEPVRFKVSDMNKFGGWARLRVVEIGRFDVEVECIDGWPREIVGRKRRVDRTQFKLWRADLEDIIRVAIGTEVVLRAARHRVYQDIVVGEIREWKHVEAA